MRTKLSLLLALVGLLIVGAAFVTNTPQRMMMVVLGLIIACGGCLVLLATDRLSTSTAASSLWLPVFLSSSLSVTS